MKTMKKTIITIALAALSALALAGCKGDNEPHRLDPGAMVYINVTNSKTLKAMDVRAEGTTDNQLLTPHEVVEQAGLFVFTDPETGKIDAALGVGDEQKDLENDRIKMWGEQIIDRDGNLVDYFIDVRDLRIEGPGDGVTPNFIAYVPNAVMEEAAAKIRKAYAVGDYDEVYRLFQKAYTAVPTNNEIWYKLKEEGKQ